MSDKVVKMRIILLKLLLYSNLLMGLLNVLIVMEIIYQARTKPKCGKLQRYQSDNKTPRIIGGTTTSITEFPHIAALLVKNRKDLNYSLICATVIISLYRTLTTCHCIDLMKNYTAKVRSGTTYWQRGGILHDITKVIRNEEYNEHYMDNDLAILCVWPSFQKKGIIKVAGPRYKLHDGSYITVTGWGETNASRSKTEFVTWSEELYTVDVQVINSNQCIRMLYFRADYVDRPAIEIMKSQFCGGTVAGGKDACVYDSGGPAMQGGVLVGLVSAGAPMCGKKNYPGIYTNIPNLNTWITNMSRIFNFNVTFVN